MKHPRCILFAANGRRCHRLAARVRMGDLFVCGQHGRITVLLMDDATSALARWTLAYSRWERPWQRQQIIDRLWRRRAA